MTREDSIRQIENYPPFNEQEEKDKALILGWISNNENAFSRENTVAHITASAWVVNKDRSKVLMVYHNIYNSWSWLGGPAGWGDGSAVRCHPGSEGGRREFPM